MLLNIEIFFEKVIQLDKIIINKKLTAEKSCLVLLLNEVGLSRYKFIHLVRLNHSPNDLRMA